MANSQFDEKNSLGQVVSIANAQGTTWGNLLQSNLSAAVRLDALYIMNTDTIDHVVTIGLCNASSGSTSSQPLFSVNVPAGAGDGTVAIVEAITAGLGAAATGLHTWPIQYFTWKVDVAVTAGKGIFGTVQGGEL